MRLKAYRVAARGNDREFSSAVGDRDIGGAPVVALAESVEDGVFVLRSFRTDKLIVAVKVYFSAGSLNAVSEFKLGARRTGSHLCQARVSEPFLPQSG